MNDAPSNDPTTTVITVSYGSEQVLPSLLDSIGDAAKAKLPVVIVDNKPSPEVRELARTRGAQYLALENPGYGGAVNAAMRRLAIATEWLLVVNPDVVFAPGSIDALVGAGRSDPTVGSVGPLILDPDGSVYPSARQLPRLATGTGHALLGSRWPDNPWSRAYRRANEEPVARDAEWLSGACLLVRRAAFEKIGGFDDAFFMYFEDVDLGSRLLAAGYRNRYEPAAVVTHSGAHSTERSIGAMTVAHHDSAYRYLMKRYPGPLCWPLRQALRAGIELRKRLSDRRS